MPPTYLAIIPARSNSKRLVNKNMKLLNSKPLVTYTIQAAIKSKKLHKIIVSTDNKKLANYAKQLGVEVPFLRPTNLALGSSPMIETVQHALTFYKKSVTKIKGIIILQPTSPFRTSSHIDESINLFEKSNADTVVSVKLMKNHPYWAWKIKNNRLKPYYTNDHMSRPREKLPQAFIENGAIWIIDKHVIDSGTLYGNKIVPYIMDDTSSIDIDTKNDFEYADYLFRKKGHE